MIWLVSFIRTFLGSLSFQDPSTNKSFSSKAVLQLCINPDSYQVGPETIGAISDIDPKFSNQEIEWSTKQRGSIILYGLLVKLDEANWTSLLNAKLGWNLASNMADMVTPRDAGVTFRMCVVVTFLLGKKNTPKTISRFMRNVCFFSKSLLS